MICVAVCEVQSFHDKRFTVYLQKSTQICDGCEHAIVCLVFAFGWTKSRRIWVIKEDRVVYAIVCNNGYPCICFVNCNVVYSCSCLLFCAICIFVVCCVLVGQRVLSAYGYEFVLFVCSVRV
jgi:hypothetical protein